MYSDEEIREVIRLLVEGEGNDEQIESWFTHELAGFMPGISDLIFYSGAKLTPEEILKRARELPKPIV